MPKHQIDDIDRKILATLQANGRITNLKLAQTVGLSPTPCSRRVKRLEEIGIIQGYAAKVDLEADNSGVTVLISIRLSGQKSQDVDNFMKAVNEQPEIIECLLVTGNVDYLLTVRTDSVKELRDFVLTRLKNIPSVAETTTMLILGSIKQSV